MLHFRLELISLPKTIKMPSWINWSRYWKISKNKGFEAQLTQFGLTNVFELIVSTNWYGEDHAGPKINLTILGLYLGLEFQDGRHWNYDEGRWYFDGEEQWDIPTAEEDEDAPLP